MVEQLILYLCFGVIVGLLAGLLGLGGGIVVVPVVALTLEWMGLSSWHVQHMALGTSFSTIVFTSIASFTAHHRQQAVLWPVVFNFSPGIIAGVIIGGLLAARLSSIYLQIVFVCFLTYAASQMIINRKPKPTRHLPGKAGTLGAGGIIGFISSLVGIGGGTLTIPFLVWCNVPMHKAVGTSAAVGLPIALVGALTYMYTGWGEPGRPDYSVGYIYIPALIGIASASMFTAPIGSKITHRLPVPVLKKIFAVLLIAMGIRMLCKLIA